ncbi:hypothetical protein B0H13DRAFT_2007964 [Mycena leptocephala]|nr:hypothetical protein B0H13DRAFT_2007964 [Mycena leptocephala]
MTEYDYSPDAPSLLSLYDGPLPSPSRPPPPHAQYEYNSIAYESPRFYRRLRHRLPPWLPVDPTNRNAVRGVAPETGPADSVLLVMSHLWISVRSDSLLELLEKIYQHYDVGHSDAFFRVSRGLAGNQALRLKRILRRYEGGPHLFVVPFSERPLVSSTARERICAAGKAGIIRICEACYRLGANIDVDRLEISTPSANGSNIFSEQAVPAPVTGLEQKNCLRGSRCPLS